MRWRKPAIGRAIRSVSPGLIPDEPADGPVPLFGHRQLLAQAISNLVENAIRYGASGGGIEVAVDRADVKVRIAVQPVPRTTASNGAQTAAGRRGITTL